MSIWKEIQKGINSDFINEPLDTKINRVEADTQDIQTKANTINTNVGSDADVSSASGSVHAKLKDLKAFSNIKSIQTGYISSGSLTTGTGEDVRYVNVSLSAVVIAKCMIYFEGGAGDSASAAALKAGSTNAGEVTRRLTSTTNLRLSTINVFSNITGRYTVIEFN